MKVCQETTPQGLLKCLLVANLCNTLQQQQQQRQAEKKHALWGFKPDKIIATQA